MNVSLTGGVTGLWGPGSSVGEGSLFCSLYLMGKHMLLLESKDFFFLGVLFSIGTMRQPHASMCCFHGVFIS